MKITHVPVSYDVMERIQKAADRVGRPAGEVIQNTLLRQVEDMERLASTSDRSDEMIKRLKEDPENSKLDDLITENDASPKVTRKRRNAKSSEAQPTPLCGYDELKQYLDNIDETHLLNNIEKSGDGYVLSTTYENRKNDYPLSIIMQVAAVLAVLGEFEKAETVHRLSWENLSPSYDKVANGIIKRFILPWPSA